MIVAIFWSAIKILWFLITIGVLVNIWQRNNLETLSKLLWSAGVFFMPFIGPIVYMLFGGHEKG